MKSYYSNIVFSYNTAFYLLNLSDRNPYEIDVTTIKNHKIRERVKMSKIANMLNMLKILKDKKIIVTKIFPQYMILLYGENFLCIKFIENYYLI